MFIRNDLESIRKIRHEVLRKGHPFESTFYPGDENDDTFHFTYANEQNENVGIISFFNQNKDYLYHTNAFRIRGTAVLPSAQHQQIGSKLLRYGIEYILSNFDVNYFWCNARRKAVKFYELQGFEKAGEEFEIDGIGPHTMMIYTPF